jgi:hypothetical protein
MRNRTIAPPLVPSIRRITLFLQIYDPSDERRDVEAIRNIFEGFLNSGSRPNVVFALIPNNTLLDSGVAMLLGEVGTYTSQSKMVWRLDPTGAENLFPFLDSESYEPFVHPVAQTIEVRACPRPGAGALSMAKRTVSEDRSEG